MKAGDRASLATFALVPLIAAACDGAAPHGTVATTTSTGAGVTTSSTPSQPTLGAANPSCQGCGEIAPVKVTLEGYSEKGSVFSGIVLTRVQWQAWGSTNGATAPLTSAYFPGAGETSTVTVYAFDLGRCLGSYGYEALEWVTPGRTFDSTTYYDVCTGKGVGRGFPGYPQ